MAALTACGPPPCGRRGCQSGTAAAMVMARSTRSSAGSPRPAESGRPVPTPPAQNPRSFPAAHERVNAGGIAEPQSGQLRGHPRRAIHRQRAGHVIVQCGNGGHVQLAHNHSGAFARSVLPLFVRSSQRSAEHRPGARRRRVVRRSGRWRRTRRPRLPHTGSDLDRDQVGGQALGDGAAPRPLPVPGVDLLVQVDGLHRHPAGQTHNAAGHHCMVRR